MKFFEERFREQGNRVRAAGQKAYMKSELRFFGVTQPQIRAAVSEFVRAHRDLDRARLKALANTAWAGESFDLRSAAAALLEKRRDLLRPADADWLIGLVRKSANWAHVDWLSAHVLGWLRPPATKLRRWGRDRDFWVQRAAMLSLLVPLRKGEGDFALFAEIAAPLVEEKEFFLRKAIGWILREVSKQRPRLAFDFLVKHRARLSGLTLREGARRLPPSLRKQLLPM
jgi:3-methyladenine DNA glycosylase AlkD